MTSGIARTVLVLSLTLFLLGLLFLIASPRDGTAPLAEIVADIVIFLLPAVWLILLGDSQMDRGPRIALDTAFLVIYLAAFLDLSGDFLELPRVLMIAQRVGFPLGMAIVTIGFSRWLRQQIRVREQLRQQEQRLLELSITDELSGLFNSRYFFQRVEQEIDRSLRYGRPLSVLFMDIDDFKRFNDQHGHLEGDKVIRELGRTIRKLLRGNDMAFRYGGEEFVAILPETPERGGGLVAERIRSHFEQLTFNPADGSGPLHATLSVGVAELDRRERPKELLRRADQALYQAKAKGKNQVFRYSHFEQ
jgi:diguanylate cyclase (GGDEF)-like protein